MKPYPLYTDYKENPDLKNISDSIKNWMSFSPGNYKKSLFKALEISKSIKDIDTVDLDEKRFIDSLYGAISYIIRIAFNHDQTISRESIESAISWMDDENKNNILEMFDKEVSNDRINTNHKILSKRFNLLKMEDSYFYQDSDNSIVFSPPFMYRVFTLIDTYSLTPPAKASLMCEEVKFLLSYNNLYTKNFYAPLYTMLYVVGNFSGDRIKLSEKILEQYVKSKYINDSRENDLDLIINTIKKKDEINKKIKDIIDTRVDDNKELITLPECNIPYTAYQLLVYYIYTGKIYSKMGFLEFTDLVSHIKVNRPENLITILNVAYYQYIYTNNLDGISLKGIITSFISFNFSSSYIAMLSNYMDILQDYIIYITSFTYDEYKKTKIDRIVKDINDVIKALDEIRIGRAAKMYDRIDKEKALAEMEMVLNEAVECYNIHALRPRELTHKIKYTPEIFPYLEYYIKTYPGVIDTASIKIAAKSIYDMAGDMLFIDKGESCINQEAMLIRRKMRNYIDSSFTESVRLLQRKNDNPIINDMADVYTYLVSLKEDTKFLNSLLSYAESKAEEYGYNDDDDYSLSEDKKKKIIKVADERKKDILEKIKIGIDKIDEKHQSIRNIFNNNAPRIVEAITTCATMGDKSKENYLKTNVFPKMRRFLELILGAALLVLSPFLFVLYLLVKIATDPNSSDSTRNAICDELEAESQIIEKRLDDAQREKDYDKEKKLLMLQKHYHRELAKIKTNKSESEKIRKGRNRK